MNTGLMAVKRKKSLELRRKGLTYREIGEQLNVSPQYIQILVRPPKEICDAVRRRCGSHCEDCRVKIDHGHIHHLEKWDEPYNGIDNLLYLCTGCHTTRHQAPNDRGE